MLEFCIHKKTAGIWHGRITCDIKAPKGLISDSACIDCKVRQFNPLTLYNNERL